MEALSRPIVEFACSSCALTMFGRDGETICCPGCDCPHVVVDERHAPERAVEPQLDAVQARASFARLFATDGEPEPGPPETTARLFFVPFYELSGTMAGVAPSGRPVHRWASASIAGLDDRDELGVAGIDGARLGGEVGAGIDGLRGSGTFLFPDRDLEEIGAFLAEQVRIPADGADTVLTDRRLRLLFYPVWRLRYEVRGHLYQATVDGVTGTVLLARVPAKQRRRAFLAVVASACGGYLLGTMLRHPAMGVPAVLTAVGRGAPSAVVASVVLAACAASLYVLILNGAWNALRYRNELLYHTGLKTRVLIDRPSETLLDGTTAWLKASWNRLVAPRRYDR